MDSLTTDEHNNVHNVDASLSPAPIDLLNLAFRDATHLEKEQLLQITGLPRKQLALAMRRHCKKKLLKYYRVKRKFRIKRKKHEPSKMSKKIVKVFPEVQIKLIKLTNLTYSKDECYENDGIFNITMKGVEEPDPAENEPMDTTSAEQTAESYAKIYKLDNQVYVHKSDFVSDVLRHMQRDASANASLNPENFKISALSFHHMKDNLCLIADRHNSENSEWHIKTEFRKFTGQKNDVELLPHGALRIGHRIFEDRVEIYEEIKTILNEKSLVEFNELKEMTNMPRFFLKKALKMVGRLEKITPVYCLRYKENTPPSARAAIAFKRWNNVLQAIDNVVVSAFGDNQYMSCKRLSYRTGLSHKLVMGSLVRIAAKNRQLWSLKMKNCKKVLNAIKTATVQAPKELIKSDQQSVELTKNVDLIENTLKPAAVDAATESDEADVESIDNALKTATADAPEGPIKSDAKPSVDDCEIITLAEDEQIPNGEQVSENKNELFDVEIANIPFIPNYVNISDEQYDKNSNALDQIQCKTFKLNIMELVDTRVMNAFRGFKYRSFKELKKLTKLENSLLRKSLRRIAHSTTRMWCLRCSFDEEPLDIWDPANLTERYEKAMHEINVYVVECFKADKYLRYRDIEWRSALSRTLLKDCLKRIATQSKNLWQLQPTMLETYAEALNQNTTPEMLSNEDLKVISAFQGEPYVELLHIQQATQLSYSQTEDALWRVGLECDTMWCLKPKAREKYSFEMSQSN